MSYSDGDNREVLLTEAHPIIQKPKITKLKEKRLAEIFAVSSKLLQP
jgi:hypothetical protein